MIKAPIALGVYDSSSVRKFLISWVRSCLPGPGEAIAVAVCTQIPSPFVQRQLLLRFTRIILAGALRHPNCYPSIVSCPLRVFWDTASLNVFPSLFLLPKIRW